MASTLGWIGLGRMGEAMVKRLLKGRHAVSVWNRTAAKAVPLIEYGATVVASKQIWPLATSFSPWFPPPMI